MKRSIMNGLLVALLLSSITPAADPAKSADDFKLHIKPILENYCYDCHGRKETKGKVKLTEFSSWKDLEKSPQLIGKMIGALEKNEMPPEDEKQPSKTQRQSLLIHLNKSLNRSLVSNQKLIPFRMRRMNRFEYGNAVRDLFDLDCWVYSIGDRIIRDHNHYFRPETGKMPDVVRVGNRIMGLQQMLENRLLGVMAFPKDPPAENGFNNRGDHLSMSPVLMKSFLKLSRSVVNAENFDKNCRSWNDLFQDPTKKPAAQRFGSITTDASVSTRSTGVTISAWIRPSKTTDRWQTIARREDSWRRQLLAIGRTGDTWGLWMGAGIAGRYVEFGASVNPKTIGDGKWHHVAGTFDGKQMNLYLDGKQIGSKAIEGKLNNQSTQPMKIGSYGGEPFHGDLNNIHLYRSGLSKIQMKRIADGDQQVAKDTLVGSWKKDDDVDLK
ncbi:MAG: DUF1587 domain-containing protein, partial [Pirellulaceae bacterium]|nr:DUF1587 domain-containing protein [Pirellulaceae bacterium]